MSDLVDALRFAVSDDNTEKVKRMIYHANEFCRTRLTRQHMAEDTFWMINNYIQLLGNNATRWRQWDDLYQEYQRNITMVPVIQYKNPLPDQVHHE
jgi:hypothetical protein